MKIFTKFIPLSADNLSRLAGRSTKKKKKKKKKNGSVATISDHVIVFNRKVSPTGCGLTVMKNTK